MIKQVFLSAMLTVLTLSQYCPMCPTSQCTYAAPGLASCANCQLGAHINVSVTVPKTNGTIEIGICQACPTGCNKCHFDFIAQYQGPGHFVNLCDKCETGYIQNYTSGGCLPLPANCEFGTCIGGWCRTVSCQRCQEGYTLLVRPINVYECYHTGKTTTDQQDDQQDNSTSAIPNPKLTSQNMVDS